LLYRVSRPKARLAITKVSETNIPPRENVTYSKETQTVVVEPLDKDGKYLNRSVIGHWFSALLVGANLICHNISTIAE